ncbi:hypothetical protein M438DRAFT_401274 [Aureobasidium pullulans EXF-150]|uniref:Uncharacterized protein n=2 Tax=Aureobasidium pullulans TaxID=5580 RepID=A0A074XZN3_AURPU|nr:uncharacterized protein M438DRAFT_401274 [Aureobasidium pullulans EXF-150]KEQ89089.1 hypothetical protein M438DRAFT_401274 [Aureobasidium pullulans EXF-150]THW52460.1 hypothetical protein D6D22_00319 [Aureobasidium pullulans]
MYRTQPKSATSPPVAAATKPETTTQPNSAPYSQSTNHRTTASVSNPQTINQQPKSSGTTNFLLSAGVLLLIAHMIMGAAIADYLSDARNSLKGFNEVVQTTTITTTKVQYVTSVDWRAPYVTKTAYGVTKVEAGKTVTETVLPTEALKRRRRDGEVMKTSKKTARTTMARVSNI